MKFVFIFLLICTSTIQRFGNVKSEVLNKSSNIPYVSGVDGHARVDNFTGHRVALKNLDATEQGYILQDNQKCDGGVVLGTASTFSDATKLCDADATCRCIYNHGEYLEHCNGDHYTLLTSTHTRPDTGDCAWLKDDEDFWPLELANVLCRNRRKFYNMDQAACQDYCLSTDTCVGICVSHEFSEYEHCVVCYGESFVDNYDGYGFHRRQG